MNLQDHDCITTLVSPVIMRHLPELNRLNSIKRLRTKVNFDYFSINVCHVRWGFIHKRCTIFKKIHNPFFIRGKRYYFVLDSGKMIYFDVSKHFEDRSIFKYQVVLNPKQFISGIEFFKFLNRIVGSLKRNNHSVGRLDISFDCEEGVLTANFLRWAAHFKWKRFSSDYSDLKIDKHRGKITGLQVKGQTLAFSAYDRRLKRKHRLYQNDFDSNFPNRLEIQIKRKAMKYAESDTIFDIHKSLGCLAIDKIALYNPTKINSGSFRYERKFKELQELVLVLGFHHARTNLNLQRNFSSRLGKHLLPIKINDGKASLIKCLQKRFSEWFEVWWPEDYIKGLDDEGD